MMLSSILHQPNYLCILEGMYGWLFFNKWACTSASCVHFGWIISDQGLLCSLFQQMGMHVHYAVLSTLFTACIKVVVFKTGLYYIASQY